MHYKRYKSIQVRRGADPAADCLADILVVPDPGADRLADVLVPDSRAHGGADAASVSW